MGETQSREITFGIDGMMCGACVSRVEKKLSRVDGVVDAAVNLSTERARLTCDRPETVEAAFDAVESAGYTPVAERLTFGVEGMSCGACVARVEKKLAGLAGVREARVNLTTERAEVVYIPGLVDRDALFAAVEKTGYTPVALDDDTAPEDDDGPSEADTLKRDLIIGAVFTLPVFVIAMARMVPGIGAAMASVLPATGWYVIELLLACPVQFWAGRRFYRLGFGELRHAAPGMNSLVLIGSNAAFFYSLVALVAPGLFPAGAAHTYFDAAAMIVTLILLGRWLEALAKGRTSQAVRGLMQLKASTARVRRDNDWVEVDIAEVAAGDRVQVRPGERVPVDGLVTAGESYVDESMISGEPVAVAKCVDDELIGGTVNQRGSLEIEASRVGEDTTLARIIRMVEDAQAEKPAIQAVADRIAGVFVPIVMALSVATFLGWLVFGPSPAISYAFVAAVSVLLIACPCAMGLATPTAIMVGTGRAAALGILFRRGTAIEQLAGIDTAVFDKTGTLTEGQPKLTSLVAVGSYSKSRTLAYAAAVEAASEHPVAAAIVTAARAQGLEIPAVSDFKVHAGQGVKAVVEGQTVVIGSAAFMTERGVALGDAAADGESEAEQARTPLFIAIDDQLAGLAAVADSERAEAAAMIEALHERGLEVAMLTGDNEATAKAVASRLGIDRVVAGVMPDAKAAEIARLQTEDQQVAFVGDGINDAPALARADVGIAIGSGTDIAIEAGDVVLMRADLAGVVNAHAVARSTLQTIRVNFGWAYGYNVLLIPLAAGALYPFTGWLLNPAIAAGAMSVSSVFVLTNSLRLRRLSAAMAVSSGTDASSDDVSSADAGSAKAAAS
ncbi:heavy metal translocating P-type ATPase [Salinisphaera sp. Q1T1-3]|uniref:heavy metal translocating P-type ATPase n=1 Tax=Salinisphaera sp. Q1T1-3 TaxID=2321229 RepID=UPI000E7314AB|nr:heavy metal translocating P-type ATPase [Salinisphaera sp. Q1T1-3]RJS93026.1 copper-translocating P-type ATPase [Salinisphaera sp. Q1T1-3]